MNRCARILLSLIALCAFLLFVFLLNFSISALPEPGRAETYIAGELRHTLVRIASHRATLPQPPSDRSASVEQGDKLFGTECADCHGLDGKTPTDEGRWMYPRAANLTSRETQQYSDRELFWVVKNGIRLSGMPAFSAVETDEHIWNLVQFVRTLPHAQGVRLQPAMRQVSKINTRGASDPLPARSRLSTLCQRKVEMSGFVPDRNVRFQGFLQG